MILVSTSPEVIDSINSKILMSLSYWNERSEEVGEGPAREGKYRELTSVASMEDLSTAWNYQEITCFYVHGQCPHQRVVVMAAMFTGSHGVVIQL